MLRGCRWQLLLFLLAGLLLAGVALWRAPGGLLRNFPAANSDSTSNGNEAAAGDAGRIAPVALIAGSTSPTTFREGLVGPLRHLNPLLAEPGSPEADISGLIFEGLTKLNARGEPVPDLARDWLIAARGLEYVVTLRDDVLWQDGVPFSATDVLFTYSLLQDQEFPGDQDLARFWRTVEIEVLAANVLRFRLTQPLGSFLDKLRLPILPWHALRGTPAARLAGHPFNLTPVGTGAWQLEALRGDDEGRLAQVDLRLSPAWLNRNADITFSIERLRFDLFASFEEALQSMVSGVIDGLLARTWQERALLLPVARAADLQITNSTVPGLGVLIFNWQREGAAFFRDQRVRLALAMSMDRSGTVERQLRDRAIVANSPLWPGSWAWSTGLEWPAEDLDAAHWLLETARSREANAAGADNAALAFSLVTPQDPALEAMMREFVGQWRRAGIEVQLDSRAPAEFLAVLQTGDFDAALMEIQGGHSSDPDIYAYWHEGQYPQGLNFGGADDRDLSELLERARREPWNINRKTLYLEMQEQFAERAIAIPLYYSLASYATGGHVEGVQPGAAGVIADRFATLAEWSVAAG